MRKLLASTYLSLKNPAFYNKTDLEAILIHGRKPFPHMGEGPLKAGFLIYARHILECTMTECMPSCSDCGFQPFCGSDPLYHYATQKDPVGHKALSGFCKKNMAIFRRLITLMEDDPAARSVLLSWARP